MQLQLNAAETAAYNGIEEALRVRITREIKQKTQALTFNLISGFHLIAGCKAEIRVGLMQQEGQLTTIALIKAEAMQIELILEEKKKKSTQGTTGINGKQPFLINQIQDEINAIRKNGYKGQNYNPNYQNHKNSNKCPYCNKPGHQIDKCFTKFPALKNQFSQKPNDNGQKQNNGQTKFC